MHIKGFANNQHKAKQRDADPERGKSAATQNSRQPKRGGARAQGKCQAGQALHCRAVVVFRGLIDQRKGRWAQH